MNELNDEANLCRSYESFSTFHVSVKMNDRWAFINMYNEKFASSEIDSKSFFFIHTQVIVSSVFLWMRENESLDI